MERKKINMGWRYVGNKNYKKGGGFNWTASQRGLNASYTLDLGLFKWNIPLLGSHVKRKSRVTMKGSGLFRLYG